jgi:tetratricopeptide (TPR) repeat protein/O-antigen ligase
MSDNLDRLPAPGTFRIAAEAVLLFLLLIAPWPFASVSGPWETLHFAAIAVITGLWATSSILSRQFSIRPDAVTWILLGLSAWTLIQLISLPASIVGMVSSRRVQLHHSLLPATAETVAGESVVAAERGAWLTLSVDPFLTWQFLSRILSLLLLYTVVRSWIASRDFLRWLALAVAVNGIALAVLAMAQIFSAPPDVIYWMFEMPGAAVFGPFVCRNHYPDYALFALGLGVAAIMARKEPKKPKVRGVEYSTGIVTKIVDSPDLFVLGLGLVLVLVSVPFSLSRGGMIGALVAAAAVATTAWQARGRISAALSIGAVIGVLALLLGAWFGWSSVADRLSTLGGGEASRGRTDLWRDILRGSSGLTLAGGGNGALARFEPLGRTDASPANLVVDFAHNEYLEAFVEGGVPRLLLTLALVLVIVRTCLKAYLRLVERSTGPYMLGAMLGLVGLCVHSLVDFGVHMPAIAGLAIVVLACVADAATNPSYLPVRKGSKSPAPEPDRGKFTLRGPAAMVPPLLLTMLAFGLLWDASRRGESAALKTAARDAQRFRHPKQFDLRVQFLSEAVESTPADGDARAKLAEACLDRAHDRQRTAVMALAGGAVFAVSPLDAFEPAGGDDHRRGVMAALAARDRSPLLAPPHLFIGLHALQLSKADPARLYFDRAVQCAPSDPEVYLLRGAEAAKRRDLTAAVADWQRAMRLSPQTIPRVLTRAGRFFEPRQILNDLLPAEPLALLMAMEQMYPRWKAGAEVERKPYLTRIASLAVSNADYTAAGWDALARAQAELNQGDAAVASWQNALRKDAKAADIRNRYAAWLELDERYDAAEEQLQWLQDNAPATPDLQLRLDAVRHARELLRVIGSP